MIGLARNASNPEKANAEPTSPPKFSSASEVIIRVAIRPGAYRLTVMLCSINSMPVNTEHCPIKRCQFPNRWFASEKQSPAAAFDAPYPPDLNDPEQS